MLFWTNFRNLIIWGSRCTKLFIISYVFPKSKYKFSSLVVKLIWISMAQWLKNILLEFLRQNFHLIITHLTAAANIFGKFSIRGVSRGGNFNRRFKEPVRYDSIYLFMHTTYIVWIFSESETVVNHVACTLQSIKIICTHFVNTRLCS